MQTIQVTTPALTAYRAHLQTVVRLAPATINRHLVSLKRYCGWACARGLIAVDPARPVKLVPRVPPPPRQLSDKEEAALLAAVTARGTPRTPRHIIGDTGVQFAWQDNIARHGWVRGGLRTRRADELPLIERDAELCLGPRQRIGERGVPQATEQYCKPRTILSEKSSRPRGFHRDTILPVDQLRPRRSIAR